MYKKIKHFTINLKLLFSDKITMHSKRHFKIAFKFAQKDSVLLLISLPFVGNELLKTIEKLHYLFINPMRDSDVRSG